MKENLTHLSIRTPNGFVPAQHPYRRQLIVSSEEDIANTFHSGGGGLFARPSDYCRMLAYSLGRIRPLLTKIRVRNSGCAPQ